MKILYHHRTASKDGQAVHIEELIGALRQLGHEVRVVAPEIGAGGDMGAEAGWVQKLKTHLPKALYELLELAYTLVAYRRLRQAAHEFKPDILYERYNLFLLAGVMLKWRLGIPMLLEVNGPLVEERSRYGGLALEKIGRWAEGTTWRGADVVLPVTNVLADHVRAYGVPEENIRIVPNGINIEHFSQAPSHEKAKEQLGLADELVLGFTGFVRDWHGVDRVIRWIASPAAPANAHLLIVGDGPVRQELEQLADRLSVGQRLTFTGVIDRQQVPAHVAAFDIALQPAVTAYASPLKLMEYLALGKAIVAPREPNLLEILTDGDNALMFDNASSKGIETALTQLAADAGLREKLGSAAAATIAQKQLTWLGNASSITDIAERLGTQHIVSEAG